MALNALQQNVISTVNQQAQRWLDTIDGEVEQMDTLINGVTQVLGSATDEEVAVVFPGLTKQNVLDTIYVLKQARNDIRANLPSFVVCANQH